MKTITTYCDICEKMTEKNDVYAVDIKWWSDNGYHRYDVCGDCKRDAEKSIKKVRHAAPNQTFLGLLRKIMKKASA